MRIEKWTGLISAASPYAIPPGAATRQENLQIRRPGELTVRPGMAFVAEASDGAVVGIFRQAGGTTQNDRLLAFTIISEQPDGSFIYALRNMERSGETLTASSVYTVTSTLNLRPSFAMDRHGAVYVFLGYGIAPRTYRYSVNQSNTVDFGLAAPTVAPLVDASGDGWFIERVDVLQSGTSYYTAPTLTVSGGSPDRNATLRAVVQAGQMVAVDVVDGGSNFRGVPTITVSNEQVGTGFRAVGSRTTASAVYGFLDSAAPTSTSGSLTAGNTHSFDLSSTSPRIAYLSGATTASVTATFDPIALTYTALIPLTPVAPATGVEAFAEVNFTPLSAAFRIGTGSVSLPGGATQYTTTAGTAINFGVARNWYTTDSYFENIYSPPDSSIDSDHSYNSNANRDAFWGLMPNPGSYKFAKRQIYKRYWEAGGTFSSGKHRNFYGNYYFPDYDRVGYRLLVGPESGGSNEANWEVGSAPVQRDGNGRPFIDVTLKPAKKNDGTAYATQPSTVFPKVRFFLQDCPEEWTLDNTIPNTTPNTDDDWRRRYNPQSGQDRRLLFTDTQNPTSANESGTLINYNLRELTVAQEAQLDTAKRWWGPGYSFSTTQARPVIDFRTSGGGGTTGIGSDTVQVLNAADVGAQLERGTRFIIRFEQYNAYDYRVEDRDEEWTWLTQADPVRYPTSLAIPVSDMQRRNPFGTNITDFYFEATSLDSAGSAASLLLPGAVTGTPRVTVTGSGWGSGQSAEFTLRQRSTSSSTFSNSVTYRFGTATLIAATSGQTIGSITIQSGGQNYFREPTLLYRGGGGYGLQTQCTVSGGRVTAVAILDGGDGFTGDTTLYTDVQPAKLLPVLRGTMRGTYRCAYRFADYSQTKIGDFTVVTTAGSTTATLAGSQLANVKPGMQITNSSAIQHLTRIVSVSGSSIKLSRPATATASPGACVVRDMTLPITYSDFSPITDVDASANGSGRASRLAWSLPGVSPPPRATHVEFYRTSSDQSLVFYRLDQYGIVDLGTISIFGTDGLSDEELFDPDRPAYAALPVVLPNGGLNAYRFGTARDDMAVAVAWQDRLWYGVSTSGKDANTVFFSEYDEFESCPDANEIPIQNNLPSTDYLTALVPFGSVLVAMQSAHCYSVGFNTDPGVDAIVTLMAHRGCLSHRTWDIYDDALYAADERGIYRMTKNGEVENLSDAVRNFWDDGALDFSRRNNWHLSVEQRTNILRLWASAVGDASPYPTFALCYHIENKCWWRETWPNSITSSSQYRSPGQQDTAIFGATDGNIYSFGGGVDYANRDVASVTVTNGGSGYTSAPTVTASGGYGASLRAVVVDGRVTEVIIARGGYGYGTSTEGVFDQTVPITISGGGGAGATATGLARLPNNGFVNGLPVPILTSIPYLIRTGNFELITNANTRNGDGLMDRSVTVTYQPQTTDAILALREYYNNSLSPRVNVMRRNRGAGFVHEAIGSGTFLNMRHSSNPLGPSTGVAKAQFAGRSLDDTAGGDRHVAIELAAGTQQLNSGDPTAQPTFFSLEVRGIADGN